MKEREGGKGGHLNGGLVQKKNCPPERAWPGVPPGWKHYKKDRRNLKTTFVGE